MAIFSDALPPRVDGVAVAVEHLARGLICSGHQVLVVGPGDSTVGCPVRRARELHELTSGERGRRSGRCTRTGNRTGIELPPESGRPEWLRLPAVPTPFDGYPVAWPRRTRLNQALLRFRPDVISAQTVGPIGLLGLSLARRHRVPGFFTWHTDFETYAQTYAVPPRLLAAGSYLPFVLNRRDLARDAPASPFAPAAEPLSGCGGLIPASLRRASLWMTAICAPSSGAADQVRRFGVRRPVFVLPAEVSRAELGPGTEAARTAWHLIPEAGVTPYLLFVGRLSREKNLDLLIEAFVHGVPAPTRLVLVGPANDTRVRARLNRWTGELPDRIVRLLPVPRAALGEIYRGAAAFVTASVSETQCLCVSEALTLGVPVLVVDPRLARDRPSGSVRVVPPEREALGVALADLARSSGPPVPGTGASSDSSAVRFVAAARLMTFRPPFEVRPSPAPGRRPVDPPDRPGFSEGAKLVWQHGRWVAS